MYCTILHDLFLHWPDKAVNVEFVFEGLSADHEDAFLTEFAKALRQRPGGDWGRGAIIEHFTLKVRKRLRAWAPHRSLKPWSTAAYKLMHPETLTLGWTLFSPLTITSWKLDLPEGCMTLQGNGRVIM